MLLSSHFENISNLNIVLDVEKHLMHCLISSNIRLHCLFVFKSGGGGGVLYLLWCDFQTMKTQCKCAWMRLVSRGGCGWKDERFQMRWEKHQPPFHFCCHYTILAGYWLTIRMWEVSFSSWSWEMGFCIPWGLGFFFSHGRSFRDGNVVWFVSVTLWCSVKYLDNHQLKLPWNLVRIFIVSL